MTTFDDTQSILGSSIFINKIKKRMGIYNVCTAIKREYQYPRNLIINNNDLTSQ
jgi:hypothetical protein